MDTLTPPRAPRRLIVAAASVLTALALLFAVPTAASAHDELIGTDPAADSTVAALPAQLTLTFSGPILTDDGSAEVQVTDAAGTSLVDGDPVLLDNTLTQPLTGSANGAITVLWRVASGDGHPISGQFGFTSTGSVTPSPAPTATTTATAAPVASPSPTEASASPTTAPTAVPAGDSGSSPLPWVLGIIAGLVVVGVGGAIVYLLVSRARRTRDLEAARPKAPAETPSTDSSDPSER